jgi:replicative DNA helicase
MDELKRIEQRQDGLTGVPSGYPSLDRVTGGWQNSDLIIIAARPSMGKTAFVVNIARNLAVLQGIPVAFFTLEMPAEQIAMRILSIESEISSNKIRTGNITDQEWIMLEEKVQLMENAPLFIDDTPQLSLFELRAKTRRLVSNHHVQLIIVDYLQLMTVAQENRMNREQVVSQISRGLKAIAKELKVPVIALSQLNRSVELRGGSKRPQLSDLRESGAIEQDADLVIFLHRPEYYGITQDAEGNSYEGIAEIIISKHRNGPLADIKLRYIKEYGKFEEIEGEQLQDINEDVEVQIISSKMNSEDVGELPDLGSSTDSLDFAPNEGFDQQFDDSDQIDHGDIPF